MKQITKAVNSENKTEILNEIEIKNQEPELFPCFLCGEFIEIKYSKRNKPYFICDPCGLQAFIRRDKGINRLNKLKGNKSFNSPEIKNSPNLILNWVNQLEKLREKLKEIGDKGGFFEFIPDKEREKSKKVIQEEINRIKGKLFKNNR
jgi:hypothetical protein